MPGLLGLGILLVTWRGIAADEDVLRELGISLWNTSGELRGGVGYKDNVLLSHTNIQGSAYWLSGAEVMVFRLPTGGWQFSFFADATDVRYLDSKSVDNEQVALAAGQLGKEFGDGWKSTFGVSYMFQNQVYDYSNVYTNRTSVGLIRGHTLKPRWALRKTIGPAWVEGEFSGTRQWLDAPLDSYWQFGPRATAGFGWGYGSELALAYQYSNLAYDHREHVDRTGAVITNSSLALDSHLVELLFTCVWDEKKHWQTVTVPAFEAVRDNGSGFYSYNSYRLSQRIRYRDERWEIAAQGRVAYYEYLTQTVGAADASLRRKTMLGATLRAECKLAKHLKAHASYMWERSISNLDFDDYGANSVVGGLALTF